MSIQTTPDEILMNEIFPKMSINRLMSLRQTDKRHRELVSKYLKISEEPTTILSIYNRSDTFYTKQNSYEIMMYFEKEYKFKRREDHTDHMSYWFSKEIVCVICFSDPINGHDNFQYLYFDKTDLTEDLTEKNGKWKFLLSKPNVMIKSLPEYIFHNYYIIDDNDESDDEEDDEIEFDISVDLFFKGELLKSFADEFTKRDYGYEDSDIRNQEVSPTVTVFNEMRRSEDIIKKYIKFFTKCFHLMKCIDIE